MARPPKSVYVLESEKRSHRTKAEIAQRSESEQALNSGVAMKETPRVRKIPDAHKEFLRIKKLLENIQKNDALYQSVINRYCLLKAECEDFETKREDFCRRASELEENMPGDADTMAYYRTLAAMQGQVIACDKQVMAKRKMLLDIEKENIMTIAAALRAIPKKPEEESGDDPMAALLKLRQA